MNRLIRWPLRVCWRLSRPIRGRLASRAEAWLDRYLVFATEAMVEEANLALDFASADLARMQAQVERLAARAEGARAFANPGGSPYNPRFPEAPAARLAPGPEAVEA